MSLETNVVKSRKGLRDGYVATNIGSVDKRVFDDPDHIEPPKFGVDFACFFSCEVE